MNGAECSALVERIQQEHHGLNRALLALRHRLETLKAEQRPGPVPADVAESLMTFRAALAEHFATEEAGDCLEELAARAPTAAAQVRRIEAEHRELLPALDRLLAYAADRSANTHELLEQFETFKRRLHAHEVFESRVFQYVLGGEASDYDVEGNE